MNKVTLTLIALSLVLHAGDGDTVEDLEVAPVANLAPQAVFMEDDEETEQQPKKSISSFTEEDIKPVSEEESLEIVNGEIKKKQKVDEKEALTKEDLEAKPVEGVVQTSRDSL